MLKGTCPKCGKVVYGWALQEPNYQLCNGCGMQLVQLEISSPNISIKESNGVAKVTEDLGYLMHVCPNCGIVWKEVLVKKEEARVEFVLCKYCKEIDEGEFAPPKEGKK